MNILYSRESDGNIPVHIQDNGKFEIHKPEGIITCPSARQLLITLTGHPQARNWTLKRYFRLKEFARPESKIIPIMTFINFFSESLKDKNKLSNEVSELSTQDTPSILIETKLGIDLNKRGHEVAKLLFAGFRGWIFGNGYDPQEVLQEVYKGILIRNAGTCPFDSRKASFGHYVHQVCHCILSNYHRRESRRYRAESLGMKTYQNGSLVGTDVSEAAMDLPTKDPRKKPTIKDDLIRLLQLKPNRENLLAMKVIPYLGMGYTQADLADLLQINRSKVSQAMITIREVADSYFTE